MKKVLEEVGKGLINFANIIVTFVCEGLFC